LAEAEAYIVGIPERPPKVVQVEIERVTDDALRELLLRVHDAKIADLRNDIVHKTAHRPTLSETRSAVHDAYQTIFRLSSHYNLGNDDYHLNERLDN
jgi:hypothetical protein